jgi:hypothetical protein
VAARDAPDARTRQARIVVGVLIVCLGLVPWVANWPYLFDPGSANREAGWLAAACGAVGIGVGIWVLAGMRFRGRAPVLTGQRWRYLGAAVALGGCLAVLFLILSTSELHMTGFPAWWVTMLLPVLFVPAGSEQQATATLTPAQYRTWCRILGGCLAVGLLLCVAAGFGIVSGNGLLAALLVPFGLVLLVFPVMFWAMYLRHQRGALQDSPGSVARELASDGEP